MQLMRDHSRCSDEERTTAAIRCCLHNGECGASICEGAGRYAPRTRIRPGNATYAAAVAECHAHGMRLCDSRELISCCGTGCGFDSALVWTHTPCTPMEHPALLAEEWLTVNLLAPAVQLSSPYVTAGTTWYSATLLPAFASASSGVASVGAITGSFVGSLVDGLAYFAAQPPVQWAAAGIVGLAVAAALVLAALGGLDGLRSSGQSDSTGLRAYGRLRDESLSRRQSKCGRRGGGAGGSPSATVGLPVPGHLPIKPPLPEYVRTGAYGRVSPTGVEHVRPGVLANRRPDGSDTGLYAVISSTTSSTNATHCDVLLFARESEARAAIARIGGDDSKPEPSPVKQLKHVSISDIGSLGCDWRPPPWEPPTFRELQFQRLELGEMYANGGGSGGQPLRVTLESPKADRDSFWRTVLRAAQFRRERRDMPWATGSDTSSPSTHSPLATGGLADGSLLRPLHASTTRSARRWLEKARNRIKPPQAHASNHV